MEQRDGGTRTILDRPAPDAALHTVIGDAPAAVLVVDLHAGTVVHANGVAGQLAPEVRLPVALDAWSAAAGLRDPDGAELDETDHPLSRLLRAEAVPGQPVSAQRRSEMGASREPLWMVGVPMTGAPVLDGHALVVFLSVREQEATAAVEALAQQEAQLRDRAVLATGLSFTLADARDPELPLVWVNQAFTAVTGYEFDEAVGRNCRFLQGEGTDPVEVARLRAALEAETEAIVTLLNYRRDGLAFWNQVTVTPIFDAAGTVTHFVGVQSDVSGRIEADRARDAALRAAEEARREAEDAQARMALLTEATDALTADLDEDAAREHLLELVVPALGDVALLYRLDADGSVRDHSARHRDPALTASAQEYAASPAAAGDLVEALLGGTPYQLRTEDTPSGALAITSTLTVGLAGRDQVRDVLVLVRTGERPSFSQEDAELALDVARRTGLILDNLRLYADQSRIAQTLQRSLLPAVPLLTWVDVDARYVAGAIGAEVGGDFYDLTQHDDQSIVVTLGDVEGHDTFAAAAMGQLRGMVRAVTLGLGSMPAATLEQLDRLLGSVVTQAEDSAAEHRAADGPDGEPQAGGRLASMVCVHLEPPPSSWTLTLSSAGHLPPLVRLPDGRTAVLDPPHARGQLLGLDSTRRRHDATFSLEPGSVLVLYTDGLVEGRGENLDEGLERLVEAASSAPDDFPGFVDHLLAELVPANRPQVGRDDIVVLALRLRDRPTED